MVSRGLDKASIGLHGRRQNGPMAQVRDLDLLLITGAGASTALGAAGTRLPMMGEWSDELVGKLLEKNYLVLWGSINRWSRASSKSSLDVSSGKSWRSRR